RAGGRRRCRCRCRSPSSAWRGGGRGTCWAWSARLPEFLSGGFAGGRLRRSRLRGVLEARGERAFEALRRFLVLRAVQLRLLALGLGVDELLHALAVGVVVRLGLEVIGERLYELLGELPLPGVELFAARCGDLGGEHDFAGVA